MRKINVCRFIDKGSDSFKTLLKLASKQSQLKAEEQTSLVMLYQRTPNSPEGMDAKKQIVLSNILFVVRIAKDYVYKTDLPLEDLVAEGCIGLMTAIERYRIQEEASFLGYASWWIRQHIQQLIEKARRQFIQENYYEPDVYDLADLLDETDDHIREAMMATGGRVSLDKPINDDDNDSESIGGLFTDDYYANDPELRKESMVIDINEALKKNLAPRDQEIMRYYYGLSGHEEKTLTQISEMMGISDERARQVVRDSTRKLRYATLLFVYRA